MAHYWAVFRAVNPAMVHWHEIEPFLKKNGVGNEVPSRKTQSYFLCVIRRHLDDKIFCSTFYY